MDSRLSGGNADTEPLLEGTPTTRDGKANYSTLQNLWTGTGWIAQLGTVLMIPLILVPIFSNAPAMLFHAHPVLNVAGLLFLVQAILTLQPTSTPEQKIKGTRFHAIFNGLSFTGFLAALIAIEANKFRSNGPHFISTHGILGMAVYALLLLQVIIGVTQYYTPKVYGSIQKAKSIWKYHRGGGYITLTLTLVAVSLSTYTSFSLNALHVDTLWVSFASLVILAGILPRVELRKFGYTPRN